MNRERMESRHFNLCFSCSNSHCPGFACCPVPIYSFASLWTLLLSCLRPYALVAPVLFRFCLLPMAEQKISPDLHPPMPFSTLSWYFCLKHLSMPLLGTGPENDRRTIPHLSYSDLTRVPSSSMLRCVLGLYLSGFLWSWGPSVVGQTSVFTTFQQLLLFSKSTNESALAKITKLIISNATSEVNRIVQ